MRVQCIGADGCWYQVGLYVIRGENLVLLGELDMQKEAQGTALREVPLEQIMKQKEAQKQEKVRVCRCIFPRRWALPQQTDRGDLSLCFALPAFPPFRPHAGGG